MKLLRKYILLIQKMMHFLVAQEQSLPSQAWVQAQASAIAGDGGVAQAGAQGPPNNLAI